MVAGAPHWPRPARDRDDAANGLSTQTRPTAAPIGIAAPPIGHQSRGAFELRPGPHSTAGLFQRISLPLHAGPHRCANLRRSRNRRNDPTLQGGGVLEAHRLDRGGTALLKVSSIVVRRVVALHRRIVSAAAAYTEQQGRDDQKDAVRSHAADSRAWRPMRQRQARPPRNLLNRTPHFPHRGTGRPTIAVDAQRAARLVRRFRRLNEPAAPDVRIATVRFTHLPSRICCPAEPAPEHCSGQPHLQLLRSSSAQQILQETRSSSEFSVSGRAECPALRTSTWF